MGVPTLYADTSPNKKCPSEKLWCYESPSVLQAGFYSPDNQTFPEFSQAKRFISAPVLLEQQRKPWACLILLMEQTIHQRRLLKKVATVLLQSRTNSTWCSRRKAPLTSLSPDLPVLTSLPDPSSQGFVTCSLQASFLLESEHTEHFSFPSPTLCSQAK